MEENQFDTIYHEHFSYFSFLTVEAIFAAHGLTPLRRRGAADPRRLAPHLRRHAGRTGIPTVSGRVAQLAPPRAAAGLEPLDGYSSFRRAGATESSASCSPS